VVCRVFHDDAPGLPELVADPEQFLARDVFRRPAFSTGAGTGHDPARFATPDRLWTDALTRGLRTPFFRLVRGGVTLPASTYCRPAGVGHRTIDDVIQPNRVLELYDDGATMVLQGLQLTDPALGRAANNVALALDQPVQINAYLTPANAHGLELHFDFHDVFVLQLDGSKRWRVWEPLPRTRDPVKTRARIPLPTLDELGEPLLDLTLTTGDCLYLPRGFPHAAETIDAASAHLTVGLLAITWQRTVRHAVDAAVEAGELTASVPARSLGTGTVDAPDLNRLARYLDPASLRPWLAREVWHRQPATRLRPLSPPVVGLDTPVDVTAGPLLWLTTDPEQCDTVFGLGDRELRLPGEAYPFLVALLDRPNGFVAAAAAGDTNLDDASRVVIMTRLAAEGVVAPA
jgi:bifunctional lysine-specific demethylase and histidyl-hydroxylase NO66